MSIAAISQSLVSAVRRGAASVDVEAAGPVRAAERVSREGPGRRHELVDAMNQVLGQETGAQDNTRSQAVVRFAHALVQDLRTMDGDVLGELGGVEEAHRRAGRAIGRRDWGDLSQRLSALATAAGRPPSDATSTPALPEMPAQPNPVTTTSAAVHIMKVPSARLLEAFVAMQRALGELDAAAQPRPALAAFAGRLAAAVSPDAAAQSAAGALLDLKV